MASLLQGPTRLAARIAKIVRNVDLFTIRLCSRRRGGQKRLFTPNALSQCNYKKSYTNTVTVIRILPHICSPKLGFQRFWHFDHLPMAVTESHAKTIFANVPTLPTSFVSWVTLSRQNDLNQQIVLRGLLRQIKSWESNCMSHACGDRFLLRCTEEWSSCLQVLMNCTSLVLKFKPGLGFVEKKGN